MVVVENLNIFSLVQLFTFLINKKHQLNDNTIHYINHSKYLKLYQLFLKSLFSKYFVKLNFKYDELKDENGVNYGFYRIENDISSLLNKTELKKYLAKLNIPTKEIGYVSGFIMKSMLQDERYGLHSLRNFLLMIKAISTYNKEFGFINGKIYFLIEKRLWIEKIKLFANKFNINIIQLNNPITFIKHFIADYLSDNKYVYIIRIIIDIIKTGNYQIFTKIEKHKYNGNPKIIIEQIYQIFNPRSFWNYAIQPNDLIFVSKLHKINVDELDEIKRLGMNFISLASSVSKGLNTDYYIPDSLLHKDIYNSLLNNSYNISTIENRKISLITNKFYRRSEYWKNLFNKKNAKIYISHDRWNADHIAASRAVRQIGGVSAIWQTSYYEFPSFHSSIYADILFSFSTKLKNVEEFMKSELQYIICTGFTYDYYFKLKIKAGKEIRKKLVKNGAKKIICIIDGGAKNDERWSVGITNYRNDYKFWLEKLLEVEWMGLIIKSKGPGSLRKRLGSVSELLSKALDSGRCFFNDNSNYYDKNLDFRVAEAALASDIAVHFCLYAGSAGLEAKLAGVQTLFFDRFNLKDSQFYKLGLNKVVFNDWGCMWNVINENFNLNKISQLKYWSTIIDDIDPFRDGMAAHRMNTYLNWLLEGFKRGLEKDNVLRVTADRYAARWGEDKVIKYN